MTKDEILVYHSIHTDTYRLLGKYVQLESSDENWIRIDREANELKDKYNGSDFAKAEILNAVDEIERIWMRNGKEKPI